MKCISSLFFLLAIPLNLVAQNSPIKFGEIDMEDMKMKVYDQDSSASAVILTDYGEASLQETNGAVELHYKRHVRIKILTDEGKSWADGSVLLFYSGAHGEKLATLKASTYNLEDGKIVASEMSKENIFHEKFNRSYNAMKFSLPNVHPGSVIEYSYSTVSDFYTNFPNWEFQKKIPVRWSEYWAIVPSSWVFEKYMQGYLNPIYNLSFDNYYGINVKAHHWTVEHSPAFKPEPFMPAGGDYISKINFQLIGIDDPLRGYREIMGSWEKMNKSLLADNDFGKVILRSSFLKPKADELTKDITDSIQKIQAIHTYVKQNIEWDKSSDFYADNLKKVIENKKGSSGEINLLLGSLLDKAGFDVSMIMLSTRNHGFIKKNYVFRTQFNYAICSVDIGNKTLLLDATEKYLPMNILPERCINGEGLIISEKKFGWIDINSKVKTRTIVNADLVLNNQGELKGKVTFTRDGYDAFDMRKDYNKKGENDYVKEILATRNWKVETTSFSEIQNLDKPVKEYHDIAIEEHASVNGGIIYLSPFVEFKEDKNPFAALTRQYPIDFGMPSEKLYSCKINLPEGYNIDEIPKSIVFSLPGNSGRFSYNVSVIGGIINITSSLVINKSLFLQKEYPLLREFYAHIIAKQEEQIVLKKK